MNTYRSPLYPALMIRLPGDGRRNIKASGGVFAVADEDVEDFEQIIAERPHYQITREVELETRPEVTGSEDVASATLNTDAATVDAVTQPEPMSESEVHPERVTVEPPLEALNNSELRARLQALGLPDDGNKATLISRLEEAASAPPAPVAADAE